MFAAICAACCLHALQIMLVRQRAASVLRQNAKCEMSQSCLRMAYEDRRVMPRRTDITVGLIWGARESPPGCRGGGVRADVRASTPAAAAVRERACADSERTGRPSSSVNAARRRSVLARFARTVWHRDMHRRCRTSRRPPVRTTSICMPASDAWDWSQRAPFGGECPSAVLQVSQRCAL